MIRKILGVLIVFFPFTMSILVSAQTFTPSFSIIGEIPVGDRPTGIAVNPDANRIYVTNGSGLISEQGSVSVIDGETNTVIATVPVGNSPYGIDVNTVTNKIYVANTNYGLDFSEPLSVIDGNTNTVINSIPVSGRPFGVAVNSATNRIFATAHYNNAVGNPYLDVIDGSTDSIIATVLNTFLCNSPQQLDVNVNTNLIYVGGDCLVTIDGSSNEMINFINLPTVPAVAVNPETNLVYAMETNRIDGHLYIVDGSTNVVLEQLLIPNANPQDLAVNTITNRIFISNHGGSVLVLDGETNTFIDPPIQVGGSLYGIAVNPITKRIYVADYVGDRVVVIEETTTPPPTTLDVSVEVLGNFFSLDENGNPIAIDDQRYASLPLKTTVTRGGVLVSGAVVSIATSPFEKILGVTDESGIVESSIDLIPPVLSNGSWTGSQKIEVVASDETGSGSSGLVEVYFVTQSQPSNITLSSIFSFR